MERVWWGRILSGWWLLFKGEVLIAGGWREINRVRHGAALEQPIRSLNLPFINDIPVSQQ